MESTQPCRQADVLTLANERICVQGCETLQTFERLAADASTPAPQTEVVWRCQGEFRKLANGDVRPALHVQASVEMPLTCQRCLHPVAVAIQVDRHWVFVPDQSLAAALDDNNEDDVLELTSTVDLLSLIEDELLMAMPLVPSHDNCLSDLPSSVADPQFDAATAQKPNPFALLSTLKNHRLD